MMGKGMGENTFVKVCDMFIKVHFEYTHLCYPPHPLLTETSSTFTILWLKKKL